MIMKCVFKNLLFLSFNFLSVAAFSQINTSILINEIDSDTPGTDTEEFVELFDGGGGNTSLDGYVLVFYNGSSDLSYKTFDLAGFMTDQNGFFLLGDTAVEDIPQRVIDSTGISLGTTAIQNGADAVALYYGEELNIPNQSSLSTFGLVEALVYGAGDIDDVELLDSLANGHQQADEGMNNNQTIHSLQRIQNGVGGAFNSSVFKAAEPTPGVVNYDPLYTDLSIIFSNDKIAGCDFGDSEKVSVTIINEGNEKINLGDTVFLFCEITSFILLEDTLVLEQDIMPNDSVDFDFRQTFDLSVVRQYNYKIYLFYENDDYELNDTIAGVIDYYELAIDLIENDSLTIALDQFPYLLSILNVFEDYLWVGSDDESNESTFYAESLGWYHITVTDSNGCSVTDSVYVEQLLNIDQVDSDFNVGIYPNPNQGNFNLIVNGGLRYLEVEVLTMSGQKVYQNVFIDDSEMTVEIPDLAKGVYFVMLRHKRGVEKQKLIIY